MTDWSIASAHARRAQALSRHDKLASRHLKGFEVASIRRVTDGWTSTWRNPIGEVAQVVEIDEGKVVGPRFAIVEKKAARA